MESDEIWEFICDCQYTLWLIDQIDQGELSSCLNKMRGQVQHLALELECKLKESKNDKERRFRTT